MEFIALLLVLVLAVCFAVWPVQLAARAVRAERTGFGSCFVALIVASVLHGIGTLFPIAGNLVAILLSAAAFAWILRTSYLGGIGVAILHAVFTAVLTAIVAAIFGLSFLALIGLTTV